jgi:hypothetical protein
MGAQPALTSLSSSLMDGDHELLQRVDRLLRPQPKPEKPVRALLPLLTGLGALIITAAVTVSMWPNSLAVVHQALEQLVH